MGSELKPQFVLFKVEENVRPYGILKKPCPHFVAKREPILLQMNTLEERDNINSLRLSAITIQNRRKHQEMKCYCYRFNKKKN